MPRTTVRPLQEGRDSIVSGVPDVAFVTLAYRSGIVANVERFYPSLPTSGATYL
jgi:hypothetical protein